MSERLAAASLKLNVVAMRQPEHAPGCEQVAGTCRVLDSLDRIRLHTDLTMWRDRHRPLGAERHDRHDPGLRQHRDGLRATPRLGELDGFFLVAEQQINGAPEGKLANAPAMAVHDEGIRQTERHERRRGFGELERPIDCQSAERRIEQIPLEIDDLGIANARPLDRGERQLPSCTEAGGHRAPAGVRNENVAHTRRTSARNGRDHAGDSGLLEVRGKQCAEGVVTDGARKGRCATQ